jgi:hypothetical protein
MDIKGLFEQLKANAMADETEKTAAAVTPDTTAEGGDEGDSGGVDEMAKLAEDLRAGGRMFADGFVDRAIEKLAGSGIPAAGGGTLRDSKMEQIASKIGAIKGATSGKPGDNTSVRAEGHHGAMSGAKGAVNPAKALG